MAILFVACKLTVQAAELSPNGFSCDIDVPSEASGIVDRYRKDMGDTTTLPVDVHGVKALLAVMRRGDQSTQLLAIGLMGSCGVKPDSEAMRTVMSAGSTIGETNREVLKRIIREKGWPVISTYGEESDQTAFLITQHANRDREFQRSVLAILAEKLPFKETSGENYALLFDRVQVGEGKPQRYGSQGRCNGNVWVPDLMERPGEVDRLRSSLGLQSMADYIQKLSGLYCAKGG